MLNVVASPDYEIVLRGVVVVQNMIQAGREIAEPIIESQITDCLQAHIARARCKFKKISSLLVRECHRFSQTKRDDYFGVIFDHF